MSKLFQSLSKIIGWLEEQDIPYMIFGGLANSIYGNPRQTYAIDVKISINNQKIRDFINEVSSIGKVLPDKPAQFIRDTNVLPIDIDGVRVDIALASLPFEKEAIERSKQISYKNIRMEVCTIEDFIIQKAVSERDKDWNDIKKVIKLNHSKIDWNYLIEHCKKLSTFLSRSEVINKILEYKNES